MLKVISSSPGELQPVFEAMLANAVRICEAKFGVLWLAEADGFRTVALHDVPPALAEARRRQPVVDRFVHSGLGRALGTKQVVHIDDYKTAPGYIERDPRVVSLVELGGLAPSLLHHCSKRVKRLARSSSSARKCGRSLKDKSRS